MTTEKNFEQLLDEYFAAIPKQGDRVTGEVISVEHNAVRVDINGVMTGVVRGPNLFRESREYGDVEVGDKVEAIVIEQENEEGEMELSFRAAGQDRVWDRVRKLEDEGMTVEAKVMNANKGGLMMKVGALAGFLPVSQLAPENYPRVPGGNKKRILEKLKEFIGETMEIKVIDVDEEEDKLIVSEKAVWEDEQKAVLESYDVGDTVEGEVSALTSFGAFVKFGEGLEGLVHISEIVWKRIDHPKDVLSVGDQVEAKIIDIEDSKIYLSMKQLKDDPWSNVNEKYQEGQEVTGEIHKIEPFGLMVKLDDEIHGLAHISKLSEDSLSVKEMKSIYNVGDSEEFEILNIEPDEHRLGLKKKGVEIEDEDEDESEDEEEDEQSQDGETSGEDSELEEASDKNEDSKEGKQEKEQEDSDKEDEPEKETEQENEKDD
ncbi:MAG: 30S ribosomal protein S1 [Candidatus Paceibacteria bacterium]